MFKRTIKIDFDSNFGYKKVNKSFENKSEILKVFKSGLKFYIFLFSD